MKLKLFSYQSLWILIGIPLLTYLILKSSFNLSLFGDDWEQLYFMWLEFEVRHSYNWFDVKSYLGPYNFSYFYLGLLNHFFGLNSFAYFFTSYLLRILATISIYLLIKFISKEKMAGFLASLIFIFSISGLETTDWVFNMNTYLGIFLFNLSVIFYLKIRSASKLFIPSIIFFILLFFLSLIVVATRVHGAVPFIILLDLVLIFLFEKKKLNIKFLLRILLPISLIFIAIKIGAFGHVGSGGFTDRLKLGYETASGLIAKGEYTFLLNLPGLIGHIALPDYIINSFVTKIGLSKASLIYLSISIVLLFLSLKNLKYSKIKQNIYLLNLIIFTSIWFVLIFMIYKSNPILSPPKYFSILIGGETVFMMGWLFLILKNKFPHISFTIVFSLLWLTAFSLIYWLFNPAVFFETASRYLIMGAVGYAIFLGSFVSFLIKTLKPNLKVIPLFVLLLWLYINFMAVQQYLSFLKANRNSKLANSIWKSLKDSITNLDTENPTIFYFTTDNPYSLHWNVVFGFPSHMGLTYKIPNLDNTPLPVSDYKTLVLYVKDGSPQKMNGRPIKPIPLDHTYAYHLSGDKLISQTDLIREQIKKDLQEP